MKDVLCQQREYGEWIALLDKGRASALAAAAREALVPLPRMPTSGGQGFRVADVYLERRGAEAPLSTLHRVRRYATEDMVWLEMKRRDAERVAVERTPVPADLASALLTSRGLSGGDADSETITGARFVTQIALLDLKPRLVVSFEREGYYMPGTALRLTVDRFIQTRPSTRWIPQRLETGIDLEERAVVKLSFDAHPPAWFRRLLREFHVTPTHFCVREAARNKLGGAQGLRTGS